MSRINPQVTRVFPILCFREKHSKRRPPAIISTQSDKGEKRGARNFLRLNTKFPFQFREKTPFVEEAAYWEDYTNFVVIFPLFFLHTTIGNIVPCFPISTSSSSKVMGNDHDINPR
jgi:hypothetical protein